MSFRLSVAVALFFISGSCFASDYSRSVMLLPSDSAFCLGDFATAEKLDRAVTVKDVAYIPAQISLLYYPEVLAATLEKAHHVVPEGEQYSVDRIVYASALLLSGSKDIYRVRSFLKFKSSDIVAEAYRDFLLATLENRPDVSLKKITDVFHRLPFFAPDILQVIFQYGIREPNPDKILPPFYHYIEILPEQSSHRYVLTAYKEMVANGGNTNEETAKWAEKAYKICPYSETISLLYADSAMKKKDFAAAEAALLKIEKKFPIHSVYIDLYLTYIYAETDDIEKMDVYLGQVDEKRDSLDPISRKNFESLKKKKTKGLVWIFITVTMLALFAGAFILNKRPKIKK